MSELATIYDYMRANANSLAARILAEYPALHRMDDAVSPRIDLLLRRPFPHKPLPSWESRNAGSGADRHGGCGMRHRQDADLAGSNPCPQRRKPVHRSSDGSTAPGRKVGARSVSDNAGDTRVPDR